MLERLVCYWEANPGRDKTRYEASMFADSEGTHRRGRTTTWINFYSFVRVLRVSILECVGLFLAEINIER